MKINPQIFREYDVRGVVGKELSPEFAYLLGRGYASLAKESGKDNISIGFDCRLSSESYANALAKGLSDEGINACIVGVGPTPYLYWTLFRHGFGGGIQVTGSHNPPDMNGFKICIGTHTVSGDEIQDLLHRVEYAAKTPPNTQKKGVISDKRVIDEYVNDLISNSKPHMGKKRLKVVVDAGNGIAGLTGPRVLRGLGIEVIELYCEPDGRFPNHHPDPTVMENIVELQKTVRETGADFGIGWDGDGDRIGAVDENGQVIFGDMLLLIYARSILKEEKGATVIGDVKCSSRLFDDIKAHGGNPLMWKTGHSLIKNKLRETGGALGGEMSGHIFFKHRFYGFDDAVYASCRLAEIVSHFPGRASELLADVPPMVATPEIRLDCPEEIKFKISNEAKRAFAEFSVDTTDGVRIRFPEGWGLVRASNTQPVLVMRFEATSEAKLLEYQSLVTNRIDQIKRTL